MVFWNASSSSSPALGGQGHNLDPNIALIGRIFDWQEERVDDIWDCPHLERGSRRRKADHPEHCREYADEAGL